MEQGCRTFKGPGPEVGECPCHHSVSVKLYLERLRTKAWEIAPSLERKPDEVPYSGACMWGGGSTVVVQTRAHRKECKLASEASVQSLHRTWCETYGFKKKTQ